MKNLLFLFLFAGCMGGESTGIFKKIEFPAPKPVVEGPEEIVQVTEITLGDISGDLVGESKNTPIKISNTTNEPLEVIYEEPEPPFYLNKGDCPDLLQPGQECNLELVFLPEDNEQYDSTITLFGQEIPLSAKAEAPSVQAPSVTAEQFTGDVVGSTESTPIKINNTFDKEINVVYEEPQPPFYLNPGTCGETLAPGAECELELVFLPEDNQQHEGVVSIYGEELTFSGKAEVLPIEAPNLSTGEFEGDVIGSSSSTPIKITNTLSKEIDVVYEQVEPPFYLDNGTCGETIAPGAECELILTFNPQDNLNHETVVSVFGSDLTFSGKAYLPDNIEILSVNYEYIAMVGNTSTIQIEILNTGERTLPAPLLDTFYPYFYSCTSGFASGETCNIEVYIEHTLSGLIQTPLTLFVENIIREIPIEFNVLAGEPAIIGSFICNKESILNDGMDTLYCSIDGIADQYGNTITEGEFFIADISNLEAMNSPVSIVNGSAEISFISNSFLESQGSFILQSGALFLEKTVEIASNTPMNGFSLTGLTLNPGESGIIYSDTIIATNGLPIVDGVAFQVMINQMSQVIDAPIEVYSSGGIIEIPVSAVSGGVADIVVMTDNAMTGVQVIVNSYPIVDAIIDCDEALLAAQGSTTGFANEANCSVFGVVDSSGASVDEFIYDYTVYLEGQLINSGQASHIGGFLVSSTSDRGELIINIDIQQMNGNFFSATKTIGVVDATTTIHTSENPTIELFRSTGRVFASSPQPAGISFEQMAGDFNWEKILLDNSGVGEAYTNAFEIRRKFSEYTDNNYLIHAGYLSDKGYQLGCMLPTGKDVLVSPGCPSTWEDMYLDENGMDEYSQTYYLNFPALLINSGDIQSDNTILTQSEGSGKISDFKNIIGGESLVGAIHFIDNVTSDIHIFGGFYRENDGNGDIFKLNYKAMRYQNALSLDEAQTTVNEVIYTHQDNYPLFKSYSKGISRSFAFGGLGVALQGEIETEIFSNDLLMFKDNDLTLVDASNKPSPRYLSALYYDERKEVVYLFGGLDEFSIPLHDIWKLDLNNESLSWELLSSEMVLDHSYSYLNRLSTYFNGNSFSEVFGTMYNDRFKQWFFMDMANPLQAIKDYSGDIFIYDINSSSEVVKYDPESNTISAGNSVDSARFKRYYSFMHPATDRLYSIISLGVTDSQLLYHDGLIGMYEIIRATVQLDDSGIKNAQSIRPKIRAVLTHNGLYADTPSLTYTEYYIYNQTAQSWEFIGKHNSSITEVGMFEGTEITNPQDYISNEGKIEIAIKPYWQNYVGIGSSDGTQIDTYIDYIAIEGVF